MASWCLICIQVCGFKLWSPIMYLIIWQNLWKFYTSNFSTPLILCTNQNICCTYCFWGIPNHLFIFPFTFAAEIWLIIHEPQDLIGLVPIVVCPGTCKYFTCCSSFHGDYFNEIKIAISRQPHGVSKNRKCLRDHEIPLYFSPKL